MHNISLGQRIKQTFLVSKQLHPAFVHVGSHPHKHTPISSYLHYTRTHPVSYLWSFVSLYVYKWMVDQRFWFDFVAGSPSSVFPAFSCRQPACIWVLRKSFSNHGECYLSQKSQLIHLKLVIKSYDDPSWGLSSWALIMFRRQATHWWWFKGRPHTSFSSTQAKDKEK